VFLEPTEVMPNHRKHGTIHRRLEDSFPISAKPTRHCDGGRRPVGGTDFEVVSKGIADPSQG
jgi:hypothetical protein